MFFVLSKLLDFFVAPLSWVMALCVAGIFLRRRRSGIALLIGSLVILYLFSIEPVSNRLWRTLEAPAIDTYHPEQSYDAVIVLSGMLSEGPTLATGKPEYNSAIERLLTAYDLLRENKAKYVLLSGGSGSLEPRVAEAPLLALQLQSWGIDKSRIQVEDKSRNTHENAVNSAAVVAAQGWRHVLLITSAFHMPRALGCFRKAGLNVDAHSVDFRGYDSASISGSWLPRANEIALSTGALREWTGRLVYRLRGYSVAVD